MEVLEQTILVVMIEDDEDQVERTRMLLELAGDSGIEIMYAYSRNEGLALLARHSVDLILLDLLLPDSPGATVAGGLGTLREVAAAAPNVAIIVQTALASREIGLQAMAAGAQDVINKDQLITPRALVRCILYSIERNRRRVALREENERLQRELTRLRAILNAPQEPDKAIAEARIIANELEQAVSARVLSLASGGG